MPYIEFAGMSCVIREYAFTNVFSPIDSGNPSLRGRIVECVPMRTFLLSIIFPFVLFIELYE